jgi:hypothetical protein
MDGITWNVVIVTDAGSTTVATYARREAALDRAIDEHYALGEAHGTDFDCIEWTNAFVRYHNRPLRTSIDVRRVDAADALDAACEICGGLDLRACSEICAITARLGYTPR